MLLYLLASDKCPYWLQKYYVVKNKSRHYSLIQIDITVTCEWRWLLYVKLSSSPMRLVHSHTFINALPKNSCFLLSTFVFTVTLSPSEIQSHCVVHKCTSLCFLFQTALCSLFPPQAAVARLPQVLSYFLLQFVIAVTASDGDCYLSNFRPRQCGLFIVILSSTLSLKTVHRTVFLTVAFKSRHRLLA